MVLWMVGKGNWMDLGISIFRQGIFCYFTYEYSGESRAKILGLWISMLETWWGIFVSMALNILDIVKVSNFKSNLGMLQHFSTDLFPAEWRTKEPLVPPNSLASRGGAWSNGLVKTVEINFSVSTCFPYLGCLATHWTILVSVIYRIEHFLSQTFSKIEQQSGFHRHVNGV